MSDRIIDFGGTPAVFKAVEDNDSVRFKELINQPGFRSAKTHTFITQLFYSITLDNEFTKEEKYKRVKMLVDEEYSITHNESVFINTLHEYNIEQCSNLIDALKVAMDAGIDINWSKKLIQTLREVGDKELIKKILRDPKTLKFL